VLLPPRTFQPDSLPFYMCRSSVGHEKIPFLISAGHEIPLGATTHHSLAGVAERHAAAALRYNNTQFRTTRL